MKAELVYRRYEECKCLGLFNGNRVLGYNVPLGINEPQPKSFFVLRRVD